MQNCFMKLCNLYIFRVLIKIGIIFFVNNYFTVTIGRVKFGEFWSLSEKSMIYCFKSLSAKIQPQIRSRTARGSLVQLASSGEILVLVTLRIGLDLTWIQFKQPKKFKANWVPQIAKITPKKANWTNKRRAVLLQIWGGNFGGCLLGQQITEFPREGSKSLQPGPP
jgi:hypothetical protein